MHELDEDAVAINGTVLAGDMDRPLEIRGDAHRQLIIVADRMGGHASGKVASRAAIHSIASNWDRCTGTVDWIALLQAANSELYDLMAETPETLGLGTTIVGVEIRSEQVTCFNVGDSHA